MPSLAEKINRLIRLTASPNMNEARNAAYQACRLLRENGIFLKEPKPKSSHKTKDHPMSKTKVTMRVCTDDAQAEAVLRDYQNAGYVLNEEKSVKATFRNDKQTIVIERADRELHIQVLG